MLKLAPILPDRDTPKTLFGTSRLIEMRRLSEKQKRWLVKHAKRNERRRLRHRPHPSLIQNSSKTQSLAIPETLSFAKNYVKTASFFSNLRKAARKRILLKIDFTTLHEIGPAAALVLAAELDCWRIGRRHRIRVLDIDKWNQDIRYILDEMGLFDLVKVVNPPSSIKSDRPSIHFIRFKSSDVADGNLARDLREDLEEVTGQIPGWQHLYRGLAEAMTNVRQHAYTSKYQKPSTHNEIQKWWMFGAYDKEQKILTCSFFDRGVGIPATLPRTHTRERIRGVLNKLGLSEDDASLIAAATEIGRTRTGSEHQGRGLVDVMEFVKQSRGGRLRILSRRGKYLYDEQGKGNTSPLPLSIEGTLIEWEITLQ